MSTGPLWPVESLGLGAFGIWGVGVGGSRGKVSVVGAVSRTAASSTRFQGQGCDDMGRVNLNGGTGVEWIAWLDSDSDIVQ